MVKCTLCNTTQTHRFYVGEYYTYLICEHCNLVFANPEERLDPAEEKLRYDQHENNPHDPQYRNFLSQLFNPLNQKLSPQSYGLDFGAGPGPTLNLMFEEAGHSMEIFDPFYANNTFIFKKTFDFITSTETVEHFYHPGREFQKLWSLLNPMGYLGVMTLLRPEKKAFPNWYYIREETHVALYSRETFHWLADYLNAELTIIGDRVILLSKPNLSE